MILLRNAECGLGISECGLGISDWGPRGYRAELELGVLRLMAQRHTRLWGGSVG